MIESFVCMNCNYKFKASKAAELCPYCNKRAVEKEKSASDLLDEVNGMLE